MSESSWNKAVIVAHLAYLAVLASCVLLTIFRSPEQREFARRLEKVEQLTQTLAGRADITDRNIRILASLHPQLQQNTQSVPQNPTTTK